MTITEGWREVGRGREVGGGGGSCFHNSHGPSFPQTVPEHFVPVHHPVELQQIKQLIGIYSIKSSEITLFKSDFNLHVIIGSLNIASMFAFLNVVKKKYKKT